MRARGFTLVEVMVALAVVAIAVPALLVALYQQIDNTGYLRDRTLAQMVASNQLAEMRLVIAATRELKRKKADGSVEFADRQWFWRSAIEPTEVARFFRLEVKVADEEGDKAAPLYTLVAFMSADVQTAEPQARNLPGPESGNGGANGGGNGGTNGGTNGGANGGDNTGANGGVTGGLPTDAQQQLLDALENAQ